MKKDVLLTLAVICWDGMEDMDEQALQAFIKESSENAFRAYENETSIADERNYGDYGAYQERMDRMAEGSGVSGHVQKLNDSSGKPRRSKTAMPREEITDEQSKQGTAVTSSNANFRTKIKEAVPQKKDCTSVATSQYPENVVSNLNPVVEIIGSKPINTRSTSQGEYFKPSHVDIAPELINCIPIICIGNAPYVYNHTEGNYEAVPLDDDVFLRLVYKYCPPRYRRELNQSTVRKIYHEVVRVLQTYYRQSCFTDKEVNDVAGQYLLTQDCIFNKETMEAISGFSTSLPFIKKCLGFRLLPFYQENPPSIKAYLDFLESITNGSEQVKILFKCFLGCLFVNSEYNPKKIAVLYGHSHTIKAIIKLTEACLNKESISHIPIDKLTDKYALKEIERKNINVSSHTDSRTLIDKLGEIIQTLGNEYIYAGNKSDECTILNNKCFVLCTDDSLNLPEIIASVDSLDSVLLIPICKAINKAKDINRHVKELSSIGGHIFLDAIFARKALEDNDWQFEPLPDMVEALAISKEQTTEKNKSETEEFIRYLEEMFIFGENEMIKQTDLEANSRDYCKSRQRQPFSKKVIIEGINSRLCGVFNITAEEYKESYNKSDRGKLKTIDGTDKWMYLGIGWKSPPQ